MAYIKKHTLTVQRVFLVDGKRVIKEVTLSVKGFTPVKEPTKAHPIGPTKKGVVTAWDKVKAGNFLPVRGKKGKVINKPTGQKQRFAVDGYK